MRDSHLPLVPIAALAILAASCAAMRPSPTSVAAQPWSRLETAHAVVWTDMDPKAAEQSARELERNRRALLMLWGPDVNPPDKLRVIALKSRAELELFIDPRYAGFFATGPAGPWLVLAGEGGYLLADSGADEKVQMHELAHAVMAPVIKHQPRWVAEGLASYLETTRVNASGEVIIGKLNLPLGQFVSARGRLPLEALRAWKDDSELRESDLQAFYATAWAWAYFFLNQRPDAFIAYLKALDAGQPEPAAWASAFPGGDLESLEVEAYAFYSNGTGAFTTAPLPPVSEQVTRTPLAPADVHAAFALLGAYSFGRRPENGQTAGTAAEVAAALELDPKNEVALALKGVRDGEPSRRAAVVTGVNPEQPNGPPCPADIAEEPVLESGDLLPRQWVAGTGAEALGDAASDVALEKIELQTGKLTGMAGNVGPHPAALVVREVERGACVVNAWGTGIPGKVDRFQTWISPDKRVAVLLVGYAPTATKAAWKGDDLSRHHWVVLATDGHRVWPALKGPGGMQATLHDAALRPQAGKLFLEVNVSGKRAGLVPFRPESGTFEQAR